jgi:hypothetical protein
MPKNIVWTALISALAVVGSIISAVFGASDLVMAFGATAISFAILSGRE